MSKNPGGRVQCISTSAPLQQSKQTNLAFCERFFCWRVLHPPRRILAYSDDRGAAAVGAGVGTAAGAGLAVGVGFAPVAVS